jgi:hypothetical protein
VHGTVVPEAMAARLVSRGMSHSETGDCRRVDSIGADRSATPLGHETQTAVSPIGGQQERASRLLTAGSASTRSDTWLQSEFAPWMVRTSCERCLSR